MRNKLLIINIIIGLIFISTIIGYIVYKDINKEKENKTQIGSINTNISVEESKSNIINTSASEEKLSPNAIMIFDIYYKKCGHTLKNRVDTPEELVNADKQYISETYPEWEILRFNQKEVELQKEVEEICEEHYIIREIDGYLAIYQLDKSGEEHLKEKTQIITKYLPEVDLMRIRDGISAVGQEELNSILEDFE